MEGSVKRLELLANFWQIALSRDIPRKGKGENSGVFTGDEWWAWVDLNHRPRPYQSSAIRFYNNLQEPRGLPKYAEVAQNIVVCGLDCGLKKSTNFVAIMPFPRDAFLRKDHSEVAVWKTAKRVLHIDHLFARM